MNDVIDICKINGEIEIDGFNIYRQGVDVVRLREKSWHGISKAKSVSQEYL